MNCCCKIMPAISVNWPIDTALGSRSKPTRANRPKTWLMRDRPTSQWRNSGRGASLGAESFTASDGEKWQGHPAFIKDLGDWAFCEGIQRFVFHRYALQPWTNPDRPPGMSMRSEEHTS